MSIVRGWCPGAWRPMLAQDGLIVRIRPRGQHSAAQVRGLAALARAQGAARLSLTSRANLQWRGLAPEQHEPLLAGLAAIGLLDADAAQERARNIVLTPFWQAGDGTLALAERLEAALADFPALPGKFGFAVDTGARPVLAGISADLRLERAADGGLLARADGAALGTKVTAETAIPTLRALADWFIATGGAPGGRGRMRAHVQAGHAPPGQTEAPAAPLPAPKPGPHAAGLLVGFAFGEIPVETLAALGDIRVTPWRMLLLPGRTTLPALPGVILDPDSPLLRVEACIGAPGCAQGFAPTRDLALALAPHVPEGVLLHVSGCGKGCAHPGPADITLTATPQGFVRHRNASAEAPGGQLLGADLHARPGDVFGPA